MDDLPDLSSFPVDERGHMGRECPEDDCLEKFSIKRVNDTLPEVHHCPTCGFKDSFDAFWSENQLERIDSILGEDEASGCEKPDAVGMGANVYNFERPEAIEPAKDIEPKKLQKIFDYKEKTLRFVYVCSECDTEFAMDDSPQNCVQCGSNILQRQ